MFKKLTLGVIGTAAILGACIPVISFSVNKPEEEKEFELNNHLFKNKEEAYSYLVRNNLSIDREKIFGDLNSSYANVEKGELIKANLSLYKKANVKMAYKLASGALTSDYSLAQHSFFNKGRIVKEYQGWTKSFDSALLAQDDIKNHTIPESTAIYGITSPSGESKWLNPLNAADTSQLRDDIEDNINNIIQDSVSGTANNYKIKILTDDGHEKQQPSNSSFNLKVSDLLSSMNRVSRIPNYSSGLNFDIYNNKELDVKWRGVKTNMSHTVHGYNTQKFHTIKDLNFGYTIRDYTDSWFEWDSGIRGDLTLPEFKKIVELDDSGFLRSKTNINKEIASTFFANKTIENDLKGYLAGFNENKLWTCIKNLLNIKSDIVFDNFKKTHGDIKSEIGDFLLGHLGDDGNKVNIVDTPSFTIHRWYDGYEFFTGKTTAHIDMAEKTYQLGYTIDSSSSIKEDNINLSCNPLALDLKSLDGNSSFNVRISNDGKDLYDGSLFFNNSNNEYSLVDPKTQKNTLVRSEGNLDLANNPDIAKALRWLDEFNAKVNNKGVFDVRQAFLDFMNEHMKKEPISKISDFGLLDSKYELGKVNGNFNRIQIIDGIKLMFNNLAFLGFNNKKTATKPDDLVNESLLKRYIKKVPNSSEIISMSKDLPIVGKYKLTSPDLFNPDTFVSPIFKRTQVTSNKNIAINDPDWAAIKNRQVLITPIEERTAYGIDNIPLSLGDAKYDSMDLMEYNSLKQVAPTRDFEHIYVNDRLVKNEINTVFHLTGIIDIYFDNIDHTKAYIYDYIERNLKWI